MWNRESTRQSDAWQMLLGPTESLEQRILPALSLGPIVVTADTPDMASTLDSFVNETNPGPVSITGHIDVLNQSLSGSFVFDMDMAADGSTVVTIAASGVSSSWTGTAGSLVLLTNGSGELVTSDNGFAGELEVTVAENIPEVDFSGTFDFTVNTAAQAFQQTLTFGADEISFDLPAGPYVRLSATNASLATAVAEVSGNLTIETSGTGATREIVLGATNVRAFVGDNRGTVSTADDVGAQLTSGSLLAVVPADGTFALNAQGTASLIGVPDLTLSGTAFAQVNTTGQAVNRSLTVGGQTVTLQLPADVERFAASDVTIEFANFVDISGDFAIEKTSSNGMTTINAAATNLDAFLGINRGQAGEFGVKVDDASLGLVIEKSGSAPAKFAVSSHGGTASLVGLAGLDLSGPLALNINQLGHAIDVDLPALDGTLVPVAFSTNDLVRSFGGDLNLSIPGFTELSGSYGFEKEGANGVTKIKVAGRNIAAFLGADADGQTNSGDETGVQISNATMGAVLYKTATGTSYALDAAGSAALVGVPGLQLVGTLAARVNTTGGGLSETVSTPAGNVIVAFADDASAQQFEGTVSLNASGFATLSGAFVFEKVGSQLTVGGADIDAFVGSGGTGLQVNDAALGAVLETESKTYALRAEGAAALVGVAGMALSGNVAVEINKTGHAVDETISTPAGDVAVSFATGADALHVVGHANLAISDFVDVSGDFVVSKETTGNETFLVVQASNVGAFLGTGLSTAESSDDVGVRLSNGALDLRVIRDASHTTYVFGARGEASLVGVDGVTASGTIVAERNTTLDDFALGFGTANTEDDLTVKSGAKRFGGTLDLSIAGFANLSGAFGFEEEVVNDATRILVAGTDLSAFVGANEGTPEATGIAISSGKLGAAISTTSSETTYALVASGAAALLGVPGLTLSGTAEIQVNRTGDEVHETIATPDGDVTIDFDDVADLTRLTGTLDLNVADFATFSGDFIVQKESTTVAGVSTTQLLFGATNVSAFVGESGGAGLSLSDGQIGLVVEHTGGATPTSGFALEGSALASLENVPGLTLTTLTALRVNKLGHAVNETLVTPGDTIEVSFDDGTEVIEATASGVNVEIVGFVTVTGDFGIRRADGRLEAWVTDASARLGEVDGPRMSVTDADVVLLIVDGKYSLTGTGHAALVGVPGLSLSGEIAMRVSNRGVAVDDAIVLPDDGGTIPIQFAGDVQEFVGNDLVMNVADFVAITGDFGFRRAGEKLELFATDVSASLGPVSGPQISVTNGRLGVLLEENAFALTASGTAALSGVPGITMSGTVEVRANRLDRIVDQSIATTTTPIELDFPTAAKVTQFRGDDLTFAIDGFVSLTADVAVERMGSTLVIGATDVTATLGVSGGPSVSVNDGTLGLLIEDSGYALTATGTAALNGVPDLTLSGTLAARANRLGRAVDQTIVTPGGSVELEFDSANDVTEFSGDDLTLAVSDFVSITGDIAVEKSGSTLLIGATDVTASLGVAGGPAVSLTDGRLGVLLEGNKFAMTASGAAALTGVPGLTLAGTLSAEANWLGRAVDTTITTPSGDVRLQFADATDVTQFAGDNVIAQVTDFVSITGDIGFRKSGTQFEAYAQDVTASLGVPGGASVSVTDATLGVLIDDGKFALVADGHAALNLPGLSLSGDLDVRVNRMGAAVDHTITTPSGDISVNFTTAADITEMSGSGMTFTVDGFASLTGNFAFARSVSVEPIAELPGATLTESKITAAGTDISAFVGAGSVGVQVSDANLGFVLAQSRDSRESQPSPSGFALVADGSAALVGVPDLTLTGHLEVQVNRMGDEVHETIVTPGGSVVIDFDDSADLTRLAGTLTADVAGFVTLDGSFAVEKRASTTDGVTTTKLVFGATNVSAFVGDGGAGLSLTEGQFGLVVQTTDGPSPSTGFALDGRGAATLENVPGLELSTVTRVRVNHLGTAVHETIATPGDPVVIEFADGTEIEEAVADGARISIANCSSACCKRF